MILTDRLFQRTPPSRNAKSIYIFCEGARREYSYFRFFKEKDSRINIEVHKIAHDDDNSPLGLFRIAINSMCSTIENNHTPKYNFIDGDEVWIVLDTDPDKQNTRPYQIEKIKSECSKRKNWIVVESNPCFEVWLYHHQKNRIAQQDLPSTCNSWKILLNQYIAGGFDSRRHPIFIQDAAKSARTAHLQNNHILVPGQTEVYHLADSIVRVLGDKIQQIRDKL